MSPSLILYLYQDQTKREQAERKERRNVSGKET
jgi:hypothetical protein